MSADDPQQYTTSEVGRNLSEIKQEQREQRKTLGDIKETLATLPHAQTINDERAREHVRRIEELEKREDDRDRDEATSRRWLLASILLPIFALIAGPIIALIVTGGLHS